MLHLANGATTARLLRQAGVEGDVLDADDLWMEGPLGTTPAHRADMLARRLGIPHEEQARRTRERDAALRRALQEEDVVLWTEQDLFCQANLCEALRRFPPTLVRRLSLAEPERAHERLGHLAPDALGARCAHRAPLTEEKLRLAHRAWRALEASDPRPLRALLDEDLAAWPALREGLLAHLRRLPAARDGLDVVERETLEILAAEGPLPFPRLFAALQGRPRFWSLGLGDVQLAAHLREMAPLVRLEGDDPARALVHATQEGRAVLRGEKDGLHARPLPERWVGGVRVDGAKTWRWDEDRMVLNANQ